MKKPTQQEHSATAKANDKPQYAAIAPLKTADPFMALPAAALSLLLPNPSPPSICEVDDADADADAEEE